MKRLGLVEPVLGGREAEYLAECVESGFVSSVGPFVDRFETAFAERVGSSYAVACASGTAALHVSLLLCGVTSDDVVPVSDFTFLASVNAVSYTGATPLLVDSERTTWNMDTEMLHDHVVELARSGSALPRAIEVVHILGVPAHLEPLLALREQFGIALVEDAAEALGATLPGGRSVGTVGELGCFSFNGNKIITTGGGGMIVTDDEELARRARHLTTQARLPGLHYRHDEIGFNYRMTNVAAALGLAQLEQLDAFLAAKHRIADRYRHHLAGRDDVTFAEPPAGATGSDWMVSICLDGTDRDAVVERLRSESIESRPVWWPAHQQAPYADRPSLLTGTSAWLGRTGLSLPSSVDLTEDDVDRVVAALSR